MRGVKPGSSFVPFALETEEVDYQLFRVRKSREPDCTIRTKKGRAWQRHLACISRTRQAGKRIERPSSGGKISGDLLLLLWLLLLRLMTLRRGSGG